ncbi:MAG: thioredoxin family protein [Sediminibacterium sp.]|jgi:polyhydroxyalkanoate synthesis regulator phasin|nr:thioredoxin family protein [Sediminibacterium sp.]
MIDLKQITRPLTYANYRTLIDDLLKEGKVTGQEQRADLTEYTRLNVARMNRVEKQAIIQEQLNHAIQEIQEPQNWIVITEGWCGDAAQLVPLIHKMAELNKNIQLTLVLRDENLWLMDQFLTNGKSRSIPKLIALNANSEVIWHWGPRPIAAQELINELTSNATDMKLLKEKLHGWYAKDRTNSAQQELLELLKA